jgi:hypothetical protein
MRPTLQSFRTKLATATPLEIVKLAYISAVVSGTAILAPALVLLPLKLRDLVLAQHGSPALRIACDILSEIVAFTPFFIGAVTLERTHSQLRNGLNANLWPIVQLQLADDFMSSRNFKTDKAYVVAISMVFAGFALYLSFHRMAMGMTLIIVNLYGMFLSPGETLKSITRLLETDLRPPAPRTNWLASPAPLYSVKWGFRDTQ